MKRIYCYILLAVLGFSFFAGCNKMEDEFSFDENSNTAMISPYCLFENSERCDYSVGRLTTKALINQTTSVDTIKCNFLRIEESTENQFSTQSYVTNWGDAYLSEGTIATVPNNQTNNLRSVSLHPEQPYNTNNGSIKSRIIGWYPRTEDVPTTESGIDASMQFHNFSSTYVLYNDKYGVKFTDLDGSMDVMVSDARDGSKNDPFDSDNFFRFKHYLSAVRIYAKAERSSQDVGLWGEIKQVVIMGQPTSCTVYLPSTASSGEERSYGANVTWGSENAKFHIQKGYLFGDRDTGNPENIIPEEYPIALAGNSVEKYLGYSLIQPNADLRVQIHTDAGVYNVVVPHTYITESGTTEIFQAGYIYNVHLDFKTDGTIFVFLENEGDEKYFDLTKGEAYHIDSDGDGDTDNNDQEIFKNKFSNCYIIYSNPSGTSQVLNGGLYDGFCFDASVVGNGEGGIISNGAQTFYPTNVHIEPASADVLWETSPRLVTQIELLHDHVRFKVAKNDGTFKEGNAVIAVYDKQGTVLWSWHIWITDKPNDISYTEGSTTITIMDRNLGATLGTVPTTEAEALASYGLYYQWGRKDPSMGPPTWNYSPINMTTAPFYDYSSDEKTAAEVVRFAAPTLQNAVENPMYLIMPTAQTQTYYFNWLYEKIDFLWGYSVTTGNTHKTIYDPCPYGYRVSGGELADLFSYATNNANSSFGLDDYGQTVNVPNGSDGTASFFFPYTGFKGVDRGLNSLVASWKYVGQKGDYQSAIVSRYTSDQEYYMHRSRIYISKESSWSELNVGNYQGRQILDHTNRRTAAPVRCVKDENHNKVNAFITPDKYTVSEGNTTVNFTLFAESFSSNLDSATLTLAYHTSNGDVHKEEQIGTWKITGGKIWNESFHYNLNTLITGGTTTGNFRFILHVKSADNINKISSTTIRLANNNIDLWAEDSKAYFIGEPVEKQIRIYGDAHPTKVEIIVNDDTDNPIDITSNLYAISDSEYTYDYYCATSGLSFSTARTHNVKIKVTYADGTSETTTNKTISVRAITSSDYTEVTSVSFDADGYYIIQNNETADYIYDGGTNLDIKNAPDYTTFFKIVLSGNSYKIMNIATQEYVTSPNNSTIRINTAENSSASTYNLTYRNNTFNIYRSNYYWLINNNSVTASRNSSNNANAKWKIYKLNTQ